MGKLLPFPSFTRERISVYIRNLSAAGKCVLCNNDVPDDKSSIVVCDDCRSARKSVRCARCESVYSVRQRAWEVHTGIDPDSFVDLDEYGPIGFVVGACRECDPQELIRHVNNIALEQKRILPGYSKPVKPAEQDVLSSKEIDKLIAELDDTPGKTNDSLFSRSLPLISDETIADAINFLNESVFDFPMLEASDGEDILGEDD